MLIHRFSAYSALFSNQQITSAAMKALGSEKDDCVMVGDGEPDIAMARAAGIDIVSVTWGFRTRSQLEAAGGRVFLDSTDQLAGL